MSSYMNPEYALNFAREWDKAVNRLVKSGVDLSKIILTPIITDREENSGQKHDTKIGGAKCGLK